MALAPLARFRPVERVCDLPAEARVVVTVDLPRRALS